jgi:hypothetical protein
MKTDLKSMIANTISEALNTKGVSLSSKDNVKALSKKIVKAKNTEEWAENITKLVVLLGVQRDSLVDVHFGDLDEGSFGIFDENQPYQKQKIVMDYLVAVSRNMFE